MYFEDPQILLNRKYYSEVTDSNCSVAIDYTKCANYCDNKSVNECICCNDHLRKKLGQTIEKNSSNKALYTDSLQKHTKVKMEIYNLGLGVLVCSILSYYYIRKYTNT